MTANQTVIRRYPFALYPTKAEDALLWQHSRMCDDLYNAFKQIYEEHFRRMVKPRCWDAEQQKFVPWPEIIDADGRKSETRRQRSLSYFDLTATVKDLRRECPEWRALPSVTLHRIAKLMSLAFASFFDRCRKGETPGYPRWRKRDRKPSIPLGTGTREVRGKKTWKTGWRFLQREDNPLSWSLYYGDADLADRATWIHARGHFPVEVAEFNNADIIWRDGKWRLSVCVEQNGTRWPGTESLVVHLDAVDCFALVNGEPQYLLELADAHSIMERADRLKSIRDERWQRPPHRDAPDREEWQNACAEIARLSAKAARIRHNALHVLTTRIVKRASDITIIMPPSIREATASAKGNEKNWGANVEMVAQINRHILNQAPALARQMLEYKAAEAGIRCDIVIDEAPNVAVGNEITKAGKKTRRAAHIIRKAAKEN